MGYDRAQMKQSVKRAMKSTTPKPMLVTLAFTAMVTAGTWLINTILGRLLTGGAGNYSDMLLSYVQRGYDMDEAVERMLLELMSRGPGFMVGVVSGGMVLSLIVTLWQSTMNVGYEGYCLSMVRGESPPIGKIFCAFPQFGPVFVTRLLTELFVILWSIPVLLGFFVLVFVFSLTAMMEVPAFTILLLLIATAALALGMVWVTLRYALVDYVVLDKGLTGTEAIRESKRLMAGRLGKAFMLRLSFIGWYLLIWLIIYGGITAALLTIVAQIAYMQSDSFAGLIAASGMALAMVAAVVIVCTVISLWLRPYVTGSMAKFYDWAKSEADGPAAGPGYGAGPSGWDGRTDHTWSSGSSSSSSYGTGLGPAPGGSSERKPPKPRDDPWN